MRFSPLLLFVSFLILVGSVACGSSWTDTGLSDTILFALSTGNSTVFAAGEDSQANKALYYSNDNGKTWQTGSLQNNALFLFTMVMSSDVSGIVGGVGLGKGAFSYTTDGKSFVPSNEPGTGLEQVQSGQLVLGTGIFGLTGQWNSINGVSFSSDGGKTFTRHNVPQFSGTVGAIGGAFPSVNNWFIAGGSSPSNNNTNSSVHFFRPHIAIRQKNIGEKIIRRAEFINKRSENQTAYYTNIVKTTDGGKTYSSVFTSSEFAPSDIRFVSESTGFFIASDGTNSFIYGTTNGGDAWSIILNAPNTLLSYAATPTATDFYVTGASLNGGGVVYSSHDGGSSWSAQIIQGVQTFATISMTGPNQGYAMGLAFDGLCHIYSYGF
jgi:photosystem II stability/assembly factor-like uncharacterized protein